MRDDILKIVTLDCSNSSLRVLLGVYDGKSIAYEIVYQSKNTIKKTGDCYHWDVLKIFRELQNGLKIAVEKTGGIIDSIGINSWGMDFILLDSSGEVLLNPLSYKNEFGADSPVCLKEQTKKELFFATGMVCDKRNTILKFAEMQKWIPDIAENIDKILMLPEALGFFLTRVLCNEPTSLGTAQLIDIKTFKHSKNALEVYALKEEWFSRMGVHGELLGYLTADNCIGLGITQNIPVIHTASYDLASAVAAIPSENEPFAFIKPGVLSVIGTELLKPQISEAAYENGFSNSPGALNTVLFKKETAGRHILQGLKEEYEAAVKKAFSWDEIISLAKGCTGEAVVVDLTENNQDYFNSMRSALTQKNGYADTDWGCLFKSAFASVAKSYIQCLKSMESVLKISFSKVYVFGLSTKNAYINEICAEKTGKKFILITADSAIYGNMAVQLKYFNPSFTLCDIRKILLTSMTVRS